MFCTDKAQKFSFCTNLIFFKKNFGTIDTINTNSIMMALS